MGFKSCHVTQHLDSSTPQNRPRPIEHLLSHPPLGGRAVERQPAVRPVMSENCSLSFKTAATMSRNHMNYWSASKLNSTWINLIRGGDNKVCLQPVTVNFVVHPVKSCLTVRWSTEHAGLKLNRHNIQKTRATAWHKTKYVDLKLFGLGVTKWVWMNDSKPK